MVAPPLVSVLMSVYNGEEELTASLDSILSQTLQELELIVVDDGSTDRTGELLAACSDPRLQVITQANSGLTLALNRAALQAQGRYLARMDVGDYSLPQRLERQVDFLEQHPEIAGCGSCTAWIDSRGEVIGTSQVVTTPAAIRRGLLKMNLLSHGSVMIRRVLFQALGGYRPFFRFAQDYDLWLRISEQYRLTNLVEVLYQWQIAPGAISARHYALQQAYRSLARQSALARRRNRPDPIELDPAPPVATSALTLDDTTAVYTATLGRACIMGGDYRAARRYLRESLSHRNRTGTLLLLLYSLLPSFIIKAGLRLRLAWLNRGSESYESEGSSHK